MVNLPAVHVSIHSPPGGLVDMKPVFGVHVKSRRRVGVRLRLSQYCMVVVYCCSAMYLIVMYFT
jgi:hypothetical protein